MKYFRSEKRFIYYHDIPGLMKELGIVTYNATEWRLFIDSSKQSLKAILLHNGNHFGSVPIYHSVFLREDYGDIKKSLNCCNIIDTIGSYVLI